MEKKKLCTYNTFLMVLSFVEKRERERESKQTLPGAGREGGGNKKRTFFF